MIKYKGFEIVFKQVGKALRYIYDGEVYADLNKVYDAIDERVKEHNDRELSYQMGDALWN